MFEAKSCDPHPVNGLQQVKCLVTHLGPEPFVITEREQNRGENRRFCIVITLKLPAVEVDDSGLFVFDAFRASLCPVLWVEVSLQHLHDAGLPATPVSEDADRN